MVPRLVAVFDAINFLYNQQRIYEFPDYKVTAAISLGIKNGKVLLDLNYEEDSKVDVDFNLVANEDLEMLEIQGTAEGAPFNKEQLNKMLEIGQEGVLDLIKLQKQVLNL